MSQPPPSSSSQLYPVHSRDGGNLLSYHSSNHQNNTVIHQHIPIAVNTVNTLLPLSIPCTLPPVTITNTNLHGLLHSTTTTIQQLHLPIHLQQYVQQLLTNTDTHMTELHHDIKHDVHVVNDSTTVQQYIDDMVDSVSNESMVVLKNESNYHAINEIKSPDVKPVKQQQSPSKSITSHKKYKLSVNNTAPINQTDIERIISHRSNPATNDIEYEVKYTNSNDTVWQSGTVLSNQEHYIYYCNHFTIQNARYNNNSTRAEMEQITVDKFDDQLLNWLNLYSTSNYDAIPLSHHDISDIKNNVMDWTQLSTRIKYLYDNQLLHTVQVDLLEQLQSILIQQLKSSQPIKLIDINTFDPIDYHNELILQKSLHSAFIASSIFITADISRTLMNDELLSCLIQFTTQCIHNIILVSYDSIFRSKHKLYTAVQRNDIITSKKSNNTNNDDIESSPVKSRDDKSIEQYWLAVQKHIHKYKPKFCNLFEYYSIYFNNERVDDEYQRVLMECCINIISCDNVNDMQHSTHQLLQSMFINGDTTRRKTILNEIILAWKSIAPNKKGLRSYKLSHPRVTYNKLQYKLLNEQYDDMPINPAQQNNSIQPLTALVILLIQSLPAAKIRDTELLNAVTNAIQQNDTVMTDNNNNLLLAIDVQSRMKFCTDVMNVFDQTKSLSSYFITNFVIQLQPSTVNAITLNSMRDTIKNLINDLLYILYQPKYCTTTIILLQQLLSYFSLIIRGNTDTIELNNDKLREFAINEISHIAVELQLNNKYMTKYPLIVAPQLSHVNMDAVPDSSNEVVDCGICGMYSIGGEEKREPQYDTVDERNKIRQSFYFDCDSCHKWLHGQCYGYSDIKQIPDQWICESCTLQQQIKLQQLQAHNRLCKLTSAKDMNHIESQQSTDGYQPDIDTTNIASNSDDNKNNYVTNAYGQTGVLISNDVLKQIIINYMTSEYYNDSTQLSARQHMLSMWLYDTLKSTSDSTNDDPINKLFIRADQLDSDDVIFCLSEWQPIDKQLFQSTITVLSRDIVIQSIKQLLVQHTLQQAVKPVTQLLLQTCSERHGKLRAASVKSLSELVTLDSTLLSDQNASRILIERLNDESILTRAAIISMISSLVISGKTDYFDRFYDKLMERSNDTGISVRKKILELFVYVLHNHHTLAIQCKIEIIKLFIHKCFIDDTNIHIYIIKTIRYLFFSTDNIIISNRMNQTQQYSAQYVELVNLIVLLISQLNQHDTEYFNDILNILIELHTNDNITEIDPRLIASIQSDRKHNKLNKHTHDNIDNNNTLSIVCDYISCVITQLIVLKTNDYTHIYPLLNALNFFAQFRPQLFVQHIITLKPYLITAHTAVKSKSMDQHEKKYSYLVAIHIISIYERCIPLYDNQIDTSIINDIIHILLDIIMYVIQNDLIRVSIICLCKIVNTVKPQYSSSCNELIHKFYTILQNSYSSIKPNDQLRGNLLKSMYALGHLIKHYDMTTYLLQSNSSFNIFTSSEQFIDRVYELYVQYIDLHVQHTEYMLFSFYGIINIIEKLPNYINHNQSQHIFNRVLDIRNNPILLVKVLKSIRTFLYYNEIIHPNDDTSDNVVDDTNNNKLRSADPSIDNKWESGRFEISDYLPILVGTIEQQIYQLVYHINDIIRYESIQIIVFLITQHITNPKQCIITLITISTDYNPSIHKLSYDSIVQYMNNKKSNIHLIYHNLLPAIKQMYKFHTAVYHDKFDPLQLHGKSSTAAAFNYNSIVDTYEQIKSNVMLRRSFIKQYINDTIQLVYSNKSSDTDGKQSQLEPNNTQSIDNRLPLLAWMLTVLSKLNFTSDDELLVLIDTITAPCVELDSIIHDIQVNLHSIAMLSNTVFIDMDDEFDIHTVITDMSVNDLIQQTIHKSSQVLYYSLLIQFKNFIYTAYGLNNKLLTDTRNNNTTRSTGTASTNKLNTNKYNRVPGIEYNLVQFPFTTQCIMKYNIVPLQSTGSALKSPNKRSTATATATTNSLPVNTIPIDELIIQRYYFGVVKMEENQIPPANLITNTTRKSYVTQYIYIHTPVLYL